MRKFLRVVLCALLMFTMTASPLMATPATSAKAASTMKIVKVNVQGARLREGPSSDYAVIGSLKKNQKIFYSGKNKNAFSYVCTADGKIGFVFRDYLSAYGSVRKNQVYYTTGRNVRMYKKASTSSGRAATLKQQQFVLVYQKAGNWAYAKTLDGTGGYIQLNKLKSANW